MKRDWSAWVWGVAILGSLLFIGARLARGPIVDTSLLSLLPAAEDDPLLAEANNVLSRRASHLMAFVVGHSDPAKAAALGHHLTDELKASGFVEQSLTDISAEQQKAFYDLYFPFRYQMLSSGDRSRLQEKDPLGPFLRRLTQTLYSPASAFFKNLIPKDPFLFFPELIRSWAQVAAPPGSTQANGIAFVGKDGLSYAFTAVQLSLDPFDSKNQDRMMAWLTDLRKRVAQEWPGSRLAMSGVLPFATAERLRTEQEMSMVSLGSLIGALLLAAAIFSSVRILAMAALPIAVGFSMALAVTLLFFGRIHIITFAFGSSLIGVAMDYPLLYLAFHRMAGKSWDPVQMRRHVSSGLLLGALTTLMGYAALSLAPFPGLRQMAVFSSVGLASALVTVLLWLPKMLRQETSLTGIPMLLSRGKSVLIGAHRLWNRASGARGTMALTVLLLFTAAGLAQLRFDDDIRRLQRPSEALAGEDAFVQSATKGVGGTRFILVRGQSLEELLQRQEELQEKLRGLIQTKTLSSVQSLAPFLPSEQKQLEDRTLLRTTLVAHADRLRREFEKVGLGSSLANELLADLRRPLILLSIDPWLASPASQLLRSLWIGKTSHGFASAVLVGGLENPQQLREALQGLIGVRFFDQGEEYTRLFRRYRHLSLELILAAYIGVWALMMIRYGAKGGTFVALPSVWAVLFTFSLFGWFRQPVHLIHCLSALLVLSMGIDYAIYFAEAARKKDPADRTLLAVELCAGATLISFGLLALCRTPVLSAIGMTVFPGMAIAALLSPLPYLAQTQPGRTDWL